MNILLWLLFGGFVGWVASILTRDNNKMGILANIIIGLIGSVIGGVISSFVGWGSISVFSWSGSILSILGAVILLTIINLINKKR